MSTRRFLNIAVLLFSLCAAAQQHASAGVDTVRLELRPAGQTVFETETVVVSLVALSDDALADEISVMEVILQWDPAILSLQGNIDPTPAMGGYDWLSSGFPVIGDSGLNQSLTDGDALYLARSQLLDPPGSAMATSSGLVVTRFEFSVVSPSLGTNVDIPLSEPVSGAETQLVGSIPNFDILSGTSGATVAIDACDALFDTDGDGDVDLVDGAQFQLCFSGSGVLANPVCRCFLDTDLDTDVDDADYTMFEAALTGPTP